MTRFMKAAGIAGLAIAATLAASPSLLATQRDGTMHENKAVVTQLNANVTAVSYWASAPDGLYVVTTVDTVSGLDTEAEQHAIVRFWATLAPGQMQLISVPVALGEQQQILRIRRIGDQIEIERVTDPAL